jgi:L-methionine (R)-S-oxide reductase
MAENYAFSNELDKKYNELESYVKAITDGEPDLYANLSNASALINLALDRINWCGFYIMKDGILVLGPFQGKPACIRIPVGRGVCGTAVKEDKTQLVYDVHEFPGHIACDDASRSEIVIPIHAKDGSVFGVLDIDSPEVGRFSECDKEGLQKAVSVIENILK